MVTRLILAAAVFCFAAQITLAAEVPITARLFVGLGSIDPKDLNDEMAAQSLTKFKDITHMGAEAAHSMKFLEVGLRYTSRFVEEEENPEDASTEYFGKIKQDSVALMLRVPIVRTTLVRADVFGGYGGTNTNFEIKTAGQDGELIRKGQDNWFRDTYSTYGASVGVGYKKVYFLVEAGFENNKVKDFQRKGTINTNVESIDLTGSFVTIGVLFDTTSKK